MGPKLRDIKSNRSNKMSKIEMSTLSKNKSNKLRKMELLQSKSRNVSVDESEDVNSKEMDDLFEKCIAEILDENYPICNDKKNTETTDGGDTEEDDDDNIS